MTIDELAVLSGTTTRRIRSFQTLGLLPHPELRGRTGLYGPEHRARLGAILRLQERGFSLESLGVLFRVAAGGPVAGRGPRGPRTGGGERPRCRGGGGHGRAVRLRRPPTCHARGAPNPAPPVGRPHHRLGREPGVLRGRHRPTRPLPSRSLDMVAVRARDDRPALALGGGGRPRRRRGGHHPGGRGLAPPVRHAQPRAPRGRPPRRRGDQPRPGRRRLRRGARLDGVRRARSTAAPPSSSATRSAAAGPRPRTMPSVPPTSS